MRTVRFHQELLLEATREFFEQRGRMISERTRDAFFATPRHLFLEKYKVSPAAEWRSYDEADLPLLYRDDGLGIFDDGQKVSTISRPAMVLYMLDMLQLEPGMRVFEIGAGSGWNAALLGALVGPTGFVESVEIIPELVERAASKVAKHVHIRLADGGSSHGDDSSSFDRVVFTTGAHDLPKQVFDRVRDGGLLLMVLKIPGSGDLLVLFRREADKLSAIESLRCEFVPMTGLGARKELDPIDGEMLFEGVVPSAARPLALNDDARSFLFATEPELRALNAGVALLRTGTAVVVKDGHAYSYGTSEAFDELQRQLHAWVDLGMPSMWTMELEAYPRGKAPAIRSRRQWLMRRRDTDFVWTA